MTLVTREEPSAGAVTALTIDDGVEVDCAVSLLMSEEGVRGGVREEMREAMGVSVHPMSAKRPG